MLGPIKAEVTKPELFPVLMEETDQKQEGTQITIECGSGEGEISVLGGRTVLAELEDITA